MSEKMSAVQIELVKPNRPDVVALIRDLDTFLKSLYPPESTHLLDVETLMQPNIRFLAALHEGRAIGCGAIRLEADYAEIKRMYVQPSWHGQGIAYRLLQALEVLAGELGFSITRLETGIRQDAALKLYERNGYVRRPPFGEYTDDPLSLCYEKHLNRTD